MWRSWGWARVWFVIVNCRASTPPDERGQPPRHYLNWRHPPAFGGALPSREREIQGQEKRRPRAARLLYSAVWNRLMEILVSRLGVLGQEWIRVQAHALVRAAQVSRFLRRGRVRPLPQDPTWDEKSELFLAQF